MVLAENENFRSFFAFCQSDGEKEKMERGKKLFRVNFFFTSAQKLFFPNFADVNVWLYKCICIHNIIYGGIGLNV